jgi:hypothetical protein
MKAYGALMTDRIRVTRPPRRSSSCAFARTKDGTSRTQSGRRRARRVAAVDESSLPTSERSNREPGHGEGGCTHRRHDARIVPAALRPCCCVSDCAQTVGARGLLSLTKLPSNVSYSCLLERECDRDASKTPPRRNSSTGRDCLLDPSASHLASGHRSNRSGTSAGSEISTKLVWIPRLLEPRSPRPWFSSGLQSSRSFS